jgi:hypothetical protein
LVAVELDMGMQGTFNGNVILANVAPEAMSFL